MKKYSLLITNIVNTLITLLNSFEKRNSLLIVIFLVFGVVTQAQPVLTDGTSNESATLDPLNDTDGQRFDVFYFNVNDSDGGTRFEFDALTVHISTATISDWTGIITGAELSDSQGNTGASALGGTINPSTITFDLTGLQGNDDLGEVNNEIVEYTVSLYFNNSISTIIDNVTLDLSVSNTDFSIVTYSLSGSASSATGGTNSIDVVATELNFSSLDANVMPATSFNAAVEAVDANGNRDENWVDDINLTHASGPGVLGGTTTQSLSSGVATYNDLTLSVEGTVELSADDAAGGTGDLTPVALSPQINVDGTPPTPVISSSDSDPTNADPISIAVDFGEDVTGFVEGDVVVGNGTITGASFSDDGGGMFSFTVNPTAEGTVTVDIAGSVATDIVGLNNNAATQFTIVSDQTSPTPAISSSDSDPTNSVAIPIAVDFGEAMTGFVEGDVVVGNGSITGASFSDDGGGMFSFTVTPSGDGSVTVDIAGSIATDVAGNNNNAATQFTIVSDQTAPTPAISSGASDPTGTSPIPIAVDFGEVMTGFVEGDIVVGNGTITGASFSDDGGGMYSFTVTPTADGAVTVDIAGSVATDPAGNNNNAATQFSIDYDTTPPTPVISSSDSDPTNADPISIAVDFGEVVTGFVEGDVVVGNGTITGASFSDDGGGMFSFTVNPTTDGTVTVDIAGSVATDAVGLNNNAATQFTIVSDQTAPTPAISSGASDPTNTNPIPISVDFGEVMTGFVEGDVVVGNGTITGASFSDDGGGMYSFTVTPSGDGTVTVDIAGSVATDPAGNNNNAATQFSIEFDSTPPTPVISSSDSDPTNADPISIAVDFGEVVTGFVEGDVVVGNGTITGASFSDDGGGMFSFTVNPTADGTVTVDIAGSVATDAVGLNNNAATQFTIVSDQTSPTPAISSSDSDPTNSVAIPIAVDFGEAMTGFVEGDVVVGNGSVTGASFSDDGGGMYSFTVTPSGDGSVTVDIAGSVATDLAGNNNNAATQFSIVSDRTAPTPSISSGASDPTGTSPIPIAVDFGEVMTGFVEGDIVVGNGTITGASFSDDGGGMYSFTVTPTADGAVTVDIAGSVATDPAGNNNNAATQFSIDYDTTPPTPVISSSDGDPSNSAAIPIAVDFGEVVTGFVEGDVVVGNGTITGASFSDDGGGMFSFTVTPTADGTVTVDIAGSVATDAVGLNNNAATQFTIVSDQTPPQVLDLEIFDANNDGFVERIDITFSEPVDTDDGLAPDITNLGTLLVPDGSTVVTAAGLGITDPPPTGLSVISVTNIAVADHLTGIETSVGSTDIDAIAGLWEDLAGNGAVDAIEGKTDSAAPILTSSTPADNSGSASQTDDFVLNFSEDIAIGPSGVRTVILNDIGGADGGGTIRTYDLTAVDPDITIGTNSITLAHASLTLDNEYAIQVTADAVDDLAVPVNSYAGILDNDGFDFTVNNIQPGAGCFDYANMYNVAAGSNNGHLAPSQCNPDPASISSIADTQAEAIAVFHFNVMNGSNIAEDVDDIDFRRGAGDNLDWSSVIAGAILIDENGVSEPADIIGTDIITFTPNAGADQLGDVAGDVAAPMGKEYALMIWLNNDLGSDAVDIDGKSLIFTLSTNDMADVDRVLSGGSYVDNSSLDLTSTVAIDVQASHYNFGVAGFVPTDTDANSIMATVQLQATDINGNRDLGYTTTDAVTITSSGTVNPAPTASSWTNGIATVSDIVHTATGGPGLTLGTSLGALNNAFFSDNPALPNSGALAATFTINTDVTPPTVNSITPNLTTIADANVGPAMFTVAVEYSEALNNAVNPVITFNPTIATTLTFTGGAFSTNINTDDTYTATYTVADANVDITGIDISANSAEDAGGAVQTVAGTENNEFDIDTENPTIAITTPVSGDGLVNALEDGALVVSGTTTLTENGQTVTVTFDDTVNPPVIVNATITSNTWTASAADISGLNQGNINITADVNDLAGNPAVQASTSVTLDQDPPSVSINTPIEGDDLVNSAESPTVSVSGNAVGADGQTVTVTFDDGTNPVVQTTGLVAAGAWVATDADISGLDDGNITVTADVDDLAGNPATPTVENITLDQVAIVAITTPIEVDDRVNIAESTTVTISGTTTSVEDAQIVTITFTDASFNTVMTSANVLTNAWTATPADISGLDEGTITVDADVTDAVGNVATTATESITLDLTSPTITIDPNIEGDDRVNIAEAGTVVVSGTTTLTENGQTVTVTFDDTVNPVVQVTGTVTANAWTASSANISGLIQGNITVTADVDDLAGNPAAPANRIINLDLTPPTIAITTPISGDDLVNAIEDGALVVNGTTTLTEDGQTVTVTFDDGSNPVVQVIAPVAANAWTAAAADISGLDEGSITVTADVTDLAGNPATQASETITLDQSATISIDTPITADNIVNGVEDDALVITGTTTGVEDGRTVTVTFDNTIDAPLVRLATVASNAWTAAAVDLGGFVDGNVNLTADVSDLAGNAAQDAHVFLSDKFPPTVTPGNIVITTDGSGSGVPPAFLVTDVVTAQWDNSATGDNNLDVASVSIDFSQFGDASSPRSAIEVLPGIWEASYTVVAGAVDAINRNVIINATDAGGNVSNVAGVDNETVDAELPVVSAGNIIIVGVGSGAGGVFIPGDAVTIQWDNTVATGDGNLDVTNVNVDFSAFGGLATNSATESLDLWSASTTISAGGSIDASGLAALVTAFDDAGNPSSSVGSPTIAIDNDEPDIDPVANVTISAGGGNSGEYIIGDVVTISWDNTGSGDNNGDITGVTIDFTEFGDASSPRTATNSSDTWSASYTIVDGGINSVVDRNGFVIATDDADNVTNQEDDASVVVDNQRPSALVQPDLIAGDDLGTSSIDNITNEAQPTFVGAAGTAVASQPVFLYSDQPGANTRLDNNAVNALADGSWTVDIAATIASDLTNDVVHNIEFTTFDPAGNESLRSPALVYEHVSPPTIVSSQWLDTDVPGDGDIDELEITFSQPVDIVDDNAEDPFPALTFSGSAAFTTTDFDLTNQLTVNLEIDPATTPGTASPGDVVTYTNAFNSVIRSTNGGIEVSNGENDTPTDGANPVIVNSITLDTDLDGDTDEIELELSEIVNDGPFTANQFDVTSPNGTETLDNFFTDVNVIASDGDSNDEFVRFIFGGGSATGTGVFDFTYNNTSVVDGNGNPFLATDIVLNDGAAPRVELATGLTPADDANLIPVVDELFVQFSEAVIGVTGRDITLAQVIPPAGFILDAEDNAEVDDSDPGGLVRLVLPSTLLSGTDYYVFMDAGSFRDAANNLSPDQFSTNTDWNFDTNNQLSVTSTTPNSAISIDLNLNDSPITINTDDAVNDFIVTDGLGATYTVDALFQSGNQLELSFDDNGLTPDLTNAAGDLTIDFDGVVGGGGATDVSTAGFGTLVDFSSLAVDFDTTDPSIGSAAVTSDTQITLTYAGNEPVQLTGVNNSDFTVTDGLNTYPVTSITDGVAGDALILLNFSGGGLNTPTGDIDIVYTSVGGISDFGSNAAGSQTLFIDSDPNPPMLDGVTTTGTTQINLDLNETVQISSASPATDFTVLDGALNPFIVSVISDAVTQDDILELTVQDWSGALGDLTLAYTASGSQISDYGDNSLGNFSGVTLEFDNTLPTISSATLISNTQIDVEFSEPVQIIGSTGFSVADERGVPFIVGGFSDVTPQDETIELTFGDLSTAVGDLIVTYNNAGSEVFDFGTTPGANLAASGNVTIDLPLTVSPVVAENATPLTEDDLVTDLAMYRSDTDPSTLTPITITPSISNSTSTIKIYREDIGLSDEVVAAQVTNISGPYSPTIGVLMGEDITDWGSTNDNNGLFTFYVTETAENGVASESAPVRYSIAFLDVIGNTAGVLGYSQSDEVGTIIGLETTEVNQGFLFAGNGLTDITYGAASSARFSPIAAGDGPHQISITVENQISGVDATFTPAELAFVVTTSSNIFEDTQNLGFGKGDGVTAIEVNSNPTNLDIGENLPTDTGNPDFHDIEVYHIINGTVNTGIGVAGVHSPAGGNIGGGESGRSLTYDSDGSIAAPINPLDGANPTYTVGEWEFDPSYFTGLGASVSEVDTLRFVSLSKADLGGGVTEINTEEIFLFPNPTVTIIDNGVIAYCEDDSPITFEAQIATYTNTAVSQGGLDTTGFITNGYLLLYSADGSFTLPQLDSINFTGNTIGTIAPQVPVGLTNFFDPRDPDQDGDMVEDETGTYRIVYFSEPQTLGNTIGSDVWEFDITPVATSPRLDLVLTGLSNNGGLNDNGTPGDVTDDFYVFEFCSGDLVPDLPINTTATPADADTYNWYNNDGSVIELGVPTLLANDEQLFTGGTNTPTGNITKEFYVTRILTNCESDSIPITIRIFDIPDEPAIDLTDNVVNNKAQNIFEDGGDYYFEYCAGQAVTITYDQLNISSNLEDILNRDFVEERSYFALYNGEFDVTPFDTVTYDLSGGSNYSIDLAAKIGATTTSSATANGIITQDFWISKVVADSSIMAGSGSPFAGCESTERTRVTVAIYTYPEIPAIDSYTGTPEDVGGVINYYMCQDETFPFVGFQPPTDAVNTEFEWYTDPGLTDKVNTANSTGQVLSVGDLTTHVDPSDPDFSVSSPGVYTYYTRLVSNINGDSGFGGCEGPVRQVNITVYPSVMKPVVSVVDPALNEEISNVGNFEHTFSFCVDAGEGLLAATAFNSSVVVPGGGLTESVQWFEADATGTAIIGSQIASADNAAGHTVSAFDLKIQGTENNTLYFAVLYNTQVIDGFPAWPGCVNSTDTTFVRVIVSTFPDTQYSFSGITAGELTTFSFFDPNGSAIEPNGVDFIVTPVGSTVREIDYEASNLNALAHSFSAPGTYDGTLSIETTAGCISTVTRRFQILEKITVSGSYREDFDTNRGGWFEEFQFDGGLVGSIGDTTRVSSWEYGVPDGSRINSTFNGSGAWATTGTTTDADGIDKENTYVGGESSFVYSPAFDISTLTNPALSIRTFRDLDGIKDGVVFQYSEDDGVSWFTLGDYDIALEFPSSGFNWYNESAISSAPGDENIDGTSGSNPRRVGWADQPATEDLGWVTSTHALTDVAGGNNVRFRFALRATGADTDEKAGEGFAFDAFEIFELGKTVLIEQFSSSISNDSKTIDETFVDANPLLGIDDDQTLWINYFTDFANTDTQADPVNERNASDPNARATYYGVDAAPKSVLDGEVFPQNSPSVRSWATNDVNIKALASAFFEFPELDNSTVTDGVISVDLTFTAQGTANNADISFIIAVVEKRVIADAAGIGVYAEDDVLYNVMRILLPGPSGFNYVGDVAVGQEFSYQVDWAIDNVYDPTQLRIIAFAQNNDPNDDGIKEVLQAGFWDVPGTTAETVLGLSDLEMFSVYPNPADDIVQIEFDGAVTKDNNWTLFDQSGKEILKGVLRKGKKLFTIDTEKVPSGMYFINIFSEENHRRVARVIIAH